MSVADSKGTAVLAQCFTPGTVFSTARMTDNRVATVTFLKINGESLRVPLRGGGITGAAAA